MLVSYAFVLSVGFAEEFLQDCRICFRISPPGMGLAEGRFYHTFPYFPSIYSASRWRTTDYIGLDIESLGILLDAFVINYSSAIRHGHVSGRCDLLRSLLVLRDSNESRERSWITSSSLRDSAPRLIAIAVSHGTLHSMYISTVIFHWRG